MKVPETMSIGELVTKCPKVQIISHNDLDGYAAAAYGVRWLRLLGYKFTDIYVTHTQPNTFPYNGEANMVLITDIAANEKNSIVEPILNAANDPTGPVVIWFDHHITSVQMEQENPEISEIYGYRNTSSCSTAQMYDEFIRTDEILRNANRDLGKVPALKILNARKDLAVGVMLSSFVENVDMWDRFTFDRDDNEPYYLSEAFKMSAAWPRNVKDIIWQEGLCGDCPRKSIKMMEKFCEFGKNAVEWSRMQTLSKFRSNGFIGHLKPELVHGGNDCALVHNYHGGSKAYYPIWTNQREDGHFSVQFPYLIEFQYTVRGCGATVYWNGYDQTQASAVDICRQFGGGGHPGCSSTSLNAISDMFTSIEPLSIELKHAITSTLKGLDLNQDTESIIAAIIHSEW